MKEKRGGVTALSLVCVASASSLAMGQWEPRVEIMMVGEEIVMIADDGAEAIAGVTARKRPIQDAGSRDMRDAPALAEIDIELNDIGDGERAAVLRAEPEDAFTIVFHVDYVDRAGVLQTRVRPAYFLCERRDTGRSCESVSLTAFWLATGQAQLVEDETGRMLLDRPLRDVGGVQ